MGLIGVNPYAYGLTEKTEPVEYIDFGVATSPASSTILEQCMKELGLSDISEEGEEFGGWRFGNLYFYICIEPEHINFDSDLKMSGLVWESLCQIPLEAPSILAQISSHHLKHYYPVIDSICVVIKPQCLMELCNAYAIAALEDQAEAVLQKYMACSETEISLGVKTIAYPRLSLLSAKHSSLGYQLALEKQELLLGLNASVVQELSPHWGVQLSQSLYKDKGVIALTDLQLEHRFGAYFARSAYIDPYIGLGISYFYNGVSQNSVGQGSVEGKPIVWQAEAHKLSQKRHSLPLSATAGVRLWLNDR